MNETAIYHLPQTAYAFNRDKETFLIRLRVSKFDKFKSVTLVYGLKYDFQTQQHKIEMNRKHEDDLFAYYEIVLKLNDSRLAYIFELKIDNLTYFYSEDGLTTTYDFAQSFYHFFQMPYTNDIDLVNVPAWTKDAVFYQIFIDRFKIGTLGKDLSYINLHWDELPTPKSFAGGDLRGIISELNYLENLGINALYLTPIFLSESNHKYDITDYYEIDPMFGDKFILKELIDQLHERGMHIVLDAVFNHAAWTHPYFVDVIKKGKASKYFDYFIIDGDYVSTETKNYQTFAKVKYMPKWNTSNPEVQDYLIEIGLYYINEFKIDGWRLDVADEVSHQFWKRFRTAIKKANPNALIIGESWHASEPWLRGDEFDSIMNYSFTKAMLDYFAFETLDEVGVSDRLNYILMRYPDNHNQMMLNLLDSHDTHRFYTQVEKNKNKLVAAVALTIMFPGIPCLYYGTEVPLEGGYDPDCRRTMPWESDFQDKEHFALMRQLIKLKKHPQLASYSYEIKAEDRLLLLSRGEQNKIIYVSNEADQEVFYQVEGEVLVSNNYSNHLLKPHGFIVYQVK